MRQGGDEELIVMSLEVYMFYYKYDDPTRQNLDIILIRLDNIALYKNITLRK